MQPTPPSLLMSSTDKLISPTSTLLPGCLTGQLQRWLLFLSADGTGEGREVPLGRLPLVPPNKYLASSFSASGGMVHPQRLGNFSDLDFPFSFPAKSRSSTMFKTKFFCFEASHLGTQQSFRNFYTANVSTPHKIRKLLFNFKKAFRNFLFGADNVLHNVVIIFPIFKLIVHDYIITRYVAHVKYIFKKISQYFFQIWELFSIV